MHGHVNVELLSTVVKIYDTIRSVSEASCFHLQVKPLILKRNWPKVHHTDHFFKDLWFNLKEEGVFLRNVCENALIIFVIMGDVLVNDADITDVQPLSVVCMLRIERDLA